MLRFFAGLNLLHEAAAALGFPPPLALAFNYKGWGDASVRLTSARSAHPPICFGQIDRGLDRPNERGDTPAGEDSVERARREPVLVVSEAPP
jgi:hypothetical protein